MEEEQILDTQRLQQQDDIGQVGPLDLRYCGSQHLILVSALSVEPGRKCGDTRGDQFISSVKFKPPGIILYNIRTS